MNERRNESITFITIFLIGIFGLAALCCYYAVRSCYSVRHLRGKAVGNSLSDDERKLRILHSFEKNHGQMVITKDSIVVETHNGENETAAEIDEERGNAIETNYVLLLHQADKASSSPPTRQVSNCCVICLEEYKIGEYVVWSCCNHSSGSSNNNNNNKGNDTHSNRCPHVHHRDCMVDYLVSYRGEGYPCPTCRRQYLTDLEK